MPFLRAGFNYRHRETGVRGWTRPLNGRSTFAPAELIRFKSGDLAWLHLAQKPRFLQWGEQVVLGSWGAIELPWQHQEGLAHCDIETRREHAAVNWSDD